MANQESVKRTIGDMVVERILLAEGYLCPESIMALTGCNRDMANQLVDEWDQKDKAA